MKKILILLLLFAAILSACSSSKNLSAEKPENQNDNQSASSLPEESAPMVSSSSWGDPSVYRAGLASHQQDSLNNLPLANEYHLDLTIDDQFQTVKGQQRLHITNNENAALDRLYFHLYPNYSGGRIEISNVLVNQQPIEPQLEANNTILLLLLPEILSPGEDIEVDMDFIISIPTEMGGNYGLFGFFDGVLVLDTFYPMLAVYDENGWHASAPDPTGDLTYTDASYYLVTVHANENVKLIASGTEIQTSQSNNEQTTTIAAGPARDFYLAASKNYQKWSKKSGEVTINSYALPQYEEAALLALDTAVSAIEIFSNHFAPYPYTEFDVISSPMRALGIEYPGITSIGIGMYDFDDQNKSLPNPIALESTVAHEVGHQWFYNMIGNDQVGEPWLDESITQYATGLYYLYRYNNASAISYRSSWDSRWQRIGRETMPIGLPVSAYDNENYSPIIYGRGPYFLMALEKEMGSDIFENFLKEYFKQFQWKNATTEAFRQLAEDTCQCDLSSLFESWVYPQ